MPGATEEMTTQNVENVSENLAELKMMLKDHFKEEKIMDEYIGALTKEGTECEEIYDIRRNVWMVKPTELVKGAPAYYSKSEADKVCRLAGKTPVVVYADMLRGKRESMIGVSALNIFTSGIKENPTMHANIQRRIRAKQRELSATA